MTDLPQAYEGGSLGYRASGVGSADPSSCAAPAPNAADRGNPSRALTACYEAFEEQEQRLVHLPSISLRDVPCPVYAEKDGGLGRARMTTSTLHQAAQGEDHRLLHALPKETMQEVRPADEPVFTQADSAQNPPCRCPSKAGICADGYASVLQVPSVVLDDATKSRSMGSHGDHGNRAVR
ncbi:hypothetical protein PCPL58_p3092 (plasmid) [Pseudomonas cerasi]|nr:hypothetical protein PCPL58_p3092 [Pseudomonas cerasi]